MGTGSTRSIINYVPDFMRAFEVLIAVRGCGNGKLEIAVAAWISYTPADTDARSIVVRNKGVASRDTVLESILVHSGQVRAGILGIAFDLVRFSIGINVLSAIVGGTWESESRSVDGTDGCGGCWLTSSST